MEEWRRGGVSESKGGRRETPVDARWSNPKNDVERQSADTIARVRRIIDDARRRTFIVFTASFA